MSISDTRKSRGARELMQRSWRCGCRRRTWLVSTYGSQCSPSQSHHGQKRYDDWSTRHWPNSRHRFDSESQKRLALWRLGADPMRAIYLAWMLGIAGGQSTNAQSTPKEVIPIATPVQCFSRHEGWIATSVGPCEGFQAPNRIVVGATFSANGRIRRIEAITAIQSDEDWSYEGFAMRKGEWACAAAELEMDLKHERGDALWLFIMPCQPTF